MPGTATWSWAAARGRRCGTTAWPSARTYYRIDVLTENSVETRFENLAELSFPDDTFVFVIAAQSMERRAEYDPSLRWRLWQMFRVSVRAER